MTELEKMAKEYAIKRESNANLMIYNSKSAYIDGFESARNLVIKELTDIAAQREQVYTLGLIDLFKNLGEKEVNNDS